MDGIKIIAEEYVSSLQYEIDKFLEGKSVKIKRCDVQYINTYGTSKLIATIVYEQNDFSTIS